MTFYEGSRFPEIAKTENISERIGGTIGSYHLFVFIKWVHTITPAGTIILSKNERFLSGNAPEDTISE